MNYVFIRKRLESLLFTLQNMIPHSNLINSQTPKSLLYKGLGGMNQNVRLAACSILESSRSNFDVRNWIISRNIADPLEPSIQQLQQQFQQSTEDDCVWYRWPAPGIDN